MSSILFYICRSKFFGTLNYFLVIVITFSPSIIDLYPSFEMYRDLL